MRKRNRSILLRFTQDELNSLEKMVVQSGMPREHFCREALLNGIVKPRPSVDFHEFTMELRRIGNNINQLTALAHSRGFIDSLRLTEQLDRLWELERQAAVLFTED